MLERAAQQRNCKRGGAQTNKGVSQSDLDEAARDRQVANITAAFLAAFLTAVVESPVELFRHNQQAGIIKGDFLREMLSTVRREGPAGLYWGFLPHCFEVKRKLRVPT